MEADLQQQQHKASRHEKPKHIHRIMVEMAHNTIKPPKTINTIAMILQALLSIQVSQDRKAWAVEVTLWPTSLFMNEAGQNSGIYIFHSVVGVTGQ